MKVSVTKPIIITPGSGTGGIEGDGGTKAIKSLGYIPTVINNETGV